MEDLQKKEEIYKKNLEDIKEIFDMQGIKFWLDWGALLGAVRDKRMLIFDKGIDDLDLGMMDTDQKRLVLAFPKFKERGFTVNETLIPIPNLIAPVPRFAFARRGHMIDMYLYRQEGDCYATYVSSWFLGKSRIMKFWSKILWFVWCILLNVERSASSLLKSLAENIIRGFLLITPEKLKEKLKKVLGKKLEVTAIKSVVQKHYFEKLDIIDYYGMQVSTPCDAENYLRYKYGESWRTPSKKWNWAKDDGSIRPI